MRSWCGIPRKQIIVIVVKAAGRILSRILIQTCPSESRANLESFGSLQSYHFAKDCFQVRRPIRPLVAMSLPLRVPWASPADFEAVFELLFSSDGQVASQQLAIDRVCCYALIVQLRCISEPCSRSTPGNLDNAARMLQKPPHLCSPSSY